MILEPEELGGEEPGVRGKGDFGADWCRLVQIGADFWLVVLDWSAPICTGGRALVK
jgi:hypothetical protein